MKNTLSRYPPPKSSSSGGGLGRCAPNVFYVISFIENNQLVLGRKGVHKYEKYAFALPSS